MTTQHSIQIQSGAVKNPLVVGHDLGKMIKARLGTPGSVLVMRVDNRYKDGNIKTVKGVLRGNKDTMSIERITPPKPSQLCIHCTNQSKYEYLGMKLCYPHYLSEERVNE